MAMSAVGTGCNKSSSNANAPSTPVDSFLVPGNVLNYTGTETVQITFANPTATTPNSTAVYTTAESDSVLNAPAGSPAALQVHKVIHYTATSAPEYGVQPATSVVDNFENLTPVGGSSSAYVVQLLQSTTVESGTNITAAVQEPSGAPYSYSSTTTTNYPSPDQILALPLNSGVTWSANMARNSTTMTNTTSASNEPYGATNLTTQNNADDSYSQTGQNSLTTTTARTLNSDGSGSTTDTNIATSAVSYILNISAPASSGSGYTIDVSTASSSTAKPKAYQVPDWYPGSAAPQSPLGSQSSTVVGPVSSLPSACTYSGGLTNIVEYDTTSSVLDPLSGTYSTSSSQNFNSNGTTVCVLSTSTVQTFSLTTGALVKTQVTTSAGSLNN
jgi:hypothetical protein